ncbi:acyl carrier protein [Micromonospora sp. BQ11]|uniref:acyl carrier protein n=1 Tax=Micromonospora sp. BQ11 TaxID=3452212 RepID=UPI003F8A2CE7
MEATAAEPDAPVLADQQSIEDWIVIRIADAQGLDPELIDVNESFIANGLGSASSVALVSDLATLLGIPLPETLAWEYPSIAALAEHVASIAPSSHND